MAMNVTVFIDESGEAGIRKIRSPTTKGASPYFVISAAVLPQAAQIQARHLLDEVREEFGGDWRHATELTHWKTKYLCRRCSEINMRLFAVVSNKATLGEYAEEIEQDSHKFYNKCVHYLLEKVGRYLEGKGLFDCDPTVVFEERNHDFDALRRYIGRIKDRPIHPDARFLKCFNPFAFLENAKSEEDLLKLADLSAHAVYQCVNKTSTNFNIPETHYLNELQSCFGADEKGRVMDAGIKCIHSLEQLQLDSDVAMRCSPTLDRRKLDFSGSFTMTGW